MATEVGIATNPLLINVEHTFTPVHVFQLRDTLESRIREHGTSKQVAADTARDIAEGLMSDRLIDLAELNRVSLTTDPDAHNEDLCENASCDGPKHHDHGTACGPLCSCGRGRG